MMTINSGVLSPSKNLVGVIGGRNNGKSTIIQSLTGCKTRSFRGYIDACDSSGNLKHLFVICSSLQEQVLKSPNQLQELGSMLEHAFQNPVCNGVVIAIQPSNPRNRVSMEDIFEKAIQIGFITYGYILNNPYKGEHVCAESVRSRLTVKGLKNSNIVELDARRFGILNAEIIRDTSEIIV